MTAQAHQTTEERMREHLAAIYSSQASAAIYERLATLLEAFRQRNPGLATPGTAERLSERDSILITYGDQVREEGRRPLETLRDVLREHLAGMVSGVHILPFFPYTSDDGFSVVDYTQIDPNLGTWEDVQAIRDAGFRMMYDAVVNHISSQSAWFQGFLRGEQPYSDYFITVEPGVDLAAVTRPRALPLLTPFPTPSGEKLVWTTFSDDQIDLNFANPALLLAMTEVLLLYVERGAELIRLDAIGYLWKEIGTRCIHLEQTHRVVQLWRAALDAVAPGTLLVTETNVPHRDNISYFGDGSNEAQMVYQFPLAPLTLNAFHTGNAGHLTRWAAGLEPMGPQATFFNFLASHDGIGVMPALGILNEHEMAELVERAQLHGGYVSYKNNPDGSRSPYELNITFFDALSNPGADEPQSRAINRFIAAHAIMLALAGVPGIYVHSLVGSPNNHAGLAETGRYRTINRQKWQRADLEAALADPQSRARQVFDRLRQLLQARARSRAFHPMGAQQVLELNEGMFALLRTSPDGAERALCLHNVSGVPQRMRAGLEELGLRHGALLRDLLSSTEVTPWHGALDLTLAPYQAMWLATYASSHA
jgi:glucosylglycerate phosphorylase